MLINLDEIRSNVETAMSVFLTSGNEKVRDIMRGTIQTELRRNKISKLRCSNFKVFLTKSGLGFDTTNISIDEECRCGKSYRDSKLLYVNHADRDNESHVYGCRCGYIYKIMFGY